jgi:hypothetical protein
VQIRSERGIDIVASWKPQLSISCTRREVHQASFAYVSKGSAREVVKAGRLLTSPCLSFIELDAEIKRLHAELDEIRSRVKKQFYRVL